MTCKETVKLETLCPRSHEQQPQRFERVGGINEIDAKTESSNLVARCTPS